MEVSMASDFQKAFSVTLIGASLFLGQTARAEVDYEGIKYLGGGEKVDLNNANIRAYLKVPGIYPSIASKIVTNGPFKTVADVYNIEGLTGAEKETIKRSEGRFVVMEGKPEYVIDKINNG
jgi:photosystem II PsbU protein